MKGIQVHLTFRLALALLFLCRTSFSFSFLSTSSSSTKSLQHAPQTTQQLDHKAHDASRRNTLLTVLTVLGIPSLVHAYEADPDPLQESLYLVSRVQEATCLQERYIEKQRPPIQKMKLTLRLVDKSYRLLDQVNFISKYMDSENVVPATQVGFAAADALEEAIDFVRSLKNDDASIITEEQRDVLKASLRETREKLFEFLDYLPQQDKLQAARARVENENKLNQDEFDPDLATDAGVYNPIVLPWKVREKKL